MNPSQFWAKPAAVILTCFATLSGVLVTSGHGKVTRIVESVGGRQDPLERSIYGATQCKKCHAEGDKAYLAGFQPDAKKKAGSEGPRGFLTCYMDEYSTWAKSDKHTLAYEALTGERGKQIGRILYGDENVAEKKECYSCHGVIAEKDSEIGPFYKASEGVTCVGCHGAAAPWIEKHITFTNKQWNDNPREQKQRLYGMTDLWNPETRTQVCASCHVGNKDEGKFLTHAMYAAGHPPLPSFETETFSYQEPQHWREVRDKKPEMRALQQFHDYKSTDSERAKLLIVGQAVALRDAIKLLGDDAADKAKESKPRDRNLDVTHFDCFACHHDLKYPGIRQSRGYAGSAGRPQPRPWPTALMPVVLRTAYPDEAAYQKALKDFEGGLVQYLQPFEDRPFGKPEAVVEGIKPVSGWLDGLIKQLGTVSYDEAATRRMLHTLSVTAQADPSARELFDVADFDSARQIAWAFDVLFSEWKLLRQAANKPAPASETRISEILGNLSANLHLDLPSGVDHSITGEKGELPGILKSIADFNPATFRALMAELDALVETN